MLAQWQNQLRRLHRWLYQRTNIRWILFGLDWACALLALPLTLWLRQKGMVELPWIFAGNGLIAVGVLLLFRSYRAFWRYTSLMDLVSIGLLVFVFELLFMPLLSLLGESVSLSFTVLHGGVLFFLWSSTRVGYRLVYEAMAGKQDKLQHFFVVVGTGREAEIFIRDVRVNHRGKAHVGGILSISKKFSKRSIHGIPVVGEVGKFDDWAKAANRKKEIPQGVTCSVVITDPEFSGKELYQLMQRAQRHRFSVKRMSSSLDPRPVEFKLATIAVEDLIGRSHIESDMTHVAAWIKGKKVLVTGAGGSIGKELSQQLFALKPRHVALLDHSEFALYQTQQALEDLKASGGPSPTTYRIWLMDLRQTNRVRDLFLQEKPDVVIHAAAFKHLPIVEGAPLEAIETNTLATGKLANLCLETGVETFLAISTDKAVYPESVLGLTKRAGEFYGQSLDHEAERTKKKTRFVSVRFGNVLESTGSAIPLFRQQIEKGKPVTITDPKVTRYFMTLQEAVSLVLHAGYLSTLPSYRRGSIYILDMGEPVRILELVENMIRFAGLRPYDDVPIRFIGLRPGEKLEETLWEKNETLQKSDHEKIFVVQSHRWSFAQLNPLFQQLEHCTDDDNAAGALKKLKDIVRVETPEPRKMGQNKVSKVS